MKVIRKSNERGHADHGWLNARHTFSFADYYDPKHTHFRTLRVINEDRIAPEMGFSTHPHRDMEIITYVVSGELQHRDSMGNTAIMRSGDVQRISAGSGIEHSEVNHSSSDPLHLLQIWIFPDRKNAKPGYAERSFASSKRGQLHLVASKSGRDGSVSINQDADLHLGKLNRGDAVDFEIRKDRHIWLQIVKGTLVVDGSRLEDGDAIALSDLGKISILAEGEVDFLLFDLN